MAFCFKVEKNSPKRCISYLCITNSNRTQQRLAVSVCSARVHLDQTIWTGLSVDVLLCLGPMFSHVCGKLCAPPICLGDQFCQNRCFSLNLLSSHHYHLYPCLVLNQPLGPTDFSSLTLIKSFVFVFVFHFTATIFILSDFISHLIYVKSLITGNPLSVVSFEVS